MNIFEHYKVMIVTIKCSLRVVATIILIIAAILILSKSILSIILTLKGYVLKRNEKSKQKHVIVTGGSSGIGLEIARVYLEQNHKVTIVARDSKKLQAARDDLITTVSKVLQSTNDTVASNLECLSCDVGSNEDAVRAALQPVIKKQGGVDVLVNCAGTSIAGVFEELPAEEFERMHRVNVLGSIYPTRVVVPIMKQNRSGQIIFIASQVAQVAIHGYTAYAASKWALRGLAEALQMEVKPFNINVSVSYPPDTDTPGYKEEMLTKPSLTKIISESGQIFPPNAVAKDIIRDAEAGCFNISTGMDGWLIKQLHPGMSPFNNVFEVLQQIMFASLARLIAVFYLLYWDYVVAEHTATNNNNKENKESDKKSK